MITFFIPFFLSFFVCCFLVYNNSTRWKFTTDYQLDGVQKFHTHPVPRVGGLCLFVGILGVGSYLIYEADAAAVFCLMLVGSALPAFGLGFIEDLTKRVGVMLRLLGAFSSAALAGFLLDAWLPNLQIFGLDGLMIAYPVLAIAITCIAVTGVVNAFNIIDGFNGLTAVVGILILSGISFVSYQLNDFQMVSVSVAMIGAIFGFLVFNYPFGRIFLGDGGAYLIGFWVAELSVLLTVRHEEVSKWFPLLLCAYPIIETLFTIYRRIFLKGVHPGMADALHLHQIIYKRVVRLGVWSKDPKERLIRNSLTSPYLWILTTMAVLPAILFWDNVFLLRCFVFIFTLVYYLLYNKLVRFRTPKWIILFKTVK